MAAQAVLYVELLAHEHEDVGENVVELVVGHPVHVGNLDELLEFAGV